MERVAFQLRIKPDKVEQYDEAHRHVWPELVRELEFFGVSDYSIFRRGQQLFLTMRVPDFEVVLKQLAGSEVNLRWQQQMEPLFEPVPGLKAGETLATMHEVFYMAGREATP